jgi:membrane dipeptidase
MDLPRNKTAEQLRLIASKGGVVGIYFMPFLNPTSVATPEDVVAHLEHAVNVCGENYGCIGTDGGTTAVDDMAAYRARTRAEIAAHKAAGGRRHRREP